MQGCHFFCTFGGMKKGLMLLGVLMLGLVALAQNYVINNNVPAGTGFTIKVDGHVVAFSDEGHFDADNMPPAVEGWLAAMEHEALLLQRGEATPHRAPRRAGNIEPLMTTRWGQRLPFNLMTPEYDEGAHCATGCVATAMAQILKYWSANIETKEIPGYTTETLGLQLEALPPTTFDYHLMNDAYDDMFDKSASAYAVAKLMRYCGQAAEMDYDVYSGAYTVGSYLAQYFGFSADYEDKDHWTHLIDWDDLIYEELEAGRPMLYSGKKMSGAGHVFVVDGYKDGYFHINWGWDGNNNGYYKLTLANPDDPDSAYLWEGYRYLQRAVIGLQPDPAATRISTIRRDSLTTDSYYNLQGQRIANPTRPGLYIHHGRKVVLK